MLLSKVVPHTSVMTKMHSGHPPTPQGVPGAPETPGGSLKNFAESRNVANQSCSTYFSDDKKAASGH